MRLYFIVLSTLLTAPLSAQTIDLAHQQNRISTYIGNYVGVPSTDNSGDNLFSWGSGDINGDGHIDLAVVAEGNDGPVGTRQDVGAIHVFFGPFFPGNAVDLRTESADLTIYGETDREGTGLFDVLIEDLNGDNQDDLIFGSAFASPLGRRQAGEVVAFFGPIEPGVIDLLVDSPDWSLLGRDGNQVSFKGDRTMPEGVADLDGDGYLDLVVTAWLGGGPTNTRDLAGEFLIIFGGPDSLISGPATLDLATLSDYYIAYGQEANDSIDVTDIADVNGDGISDIIFSGQTNGPLNDRDLAGSIGVLYGGAHLRPDPGTIISQDFAVDPPDLLIHGREIFDFLRWATVGDFNNDDQSDLLIGAWFASGPDNTRFGAGETYLLFGGSTLTTTPIPQEIDLATPGTFDTVIYGADPDDLSGFIVNPAKVNDDPFDDVLISAIYADGPDNTRENAGEVYVLYGGPMFPSEIDLRDPVDIHFIGEEAGIPNNDGEVGDNLTLGFHEDLNEDGFDEILLAASKADGPNNERQGAGDVHIYFPDNDEDGDGVFNSDDLCGSTAPGAIVDPATGCSIAQLCPCEHQFGDDNRRWRNHAHYVWCVNRTARYFHKVLGLISKKERRAIVRAAQRSDCGKRRPRTPGKK